MRVLVVGAGGREHALTWKLAQSPRVDRVFCAPGNGGTSGIAENVPIQPDDINALVKFAADQQIRLTVVGPEDPLSAGIVDRFDSAGLRIFGPNRAAAKIEGDKAHAKHIMRECGIPTADARIFGPTEQEIAHSRQPGAGRDEAFPRDVQRGYDLARHFVDTREEGVVVKAAGLAKGKGVFVYRDPKDALPTLRALMVDRILGEAGERIVVEDLLIGTEVSVMALVDGNNIYILEAATDYKRIGDGDTGPNTGGMGAYSPAVTLTDDLLAVVERQILVPIVDGMRRQGVEYKGVLYVGLMLTAGGPKVLEFNCRFGDPETQPILMRLKTDLLDILEATVDGRLDRIDIEWDPRPAVCVVMASAGYPDRVETGVAITGIDDALRCDGVQVFHAGTTTRDDRLVTSGGRVLGVTAIGDTLASARHQAYEATQRIQFDGAYCRGDIAAQAGG